MVVLMSTEELSPEIHQSAISVAYLSLVSSYAGIAGAHGRSVRHCLLLVWTVLASRTVGVAINITRQADHDLDNLDPNQLW